MTDHQIQYYRTMCTEKATVLQFKYNAACLNLLFECMYVLYGLWELLAKRLW